MTGLFWRCFSLGFFSFWLMLRLLRGHRLGSALPLRGRKYCEDVSSSVSKTGSIALSACSEDILGGFVFLILLLLCVSVWARPVPAAGSFAKLQGSSFVCDRFLFARFAVLSVPLFNCGTMSGAFSRTFAIAARLFGENNDLTAISSPVSLRLPLSMTETCWDISKDMCASSKKVSELVIEIGRDCYLLTSLDV